MHFITHHVFFFIWILYWIKHSPYYYYKHDAIFYSLYYMLILTYKLQHYACAIMNSSPFGYRVIDVVGKLKIVILPTKLKYSLLVSSGRWGKEIKQIITW